MATLNQINTMLISNGWVQSSKYPQGQKEGMFIEDISFADDAFTFWVRAEITIDSDADLDTKLSKICEGSISEGDQGSPTVVYLCESIGHWTLDSTPNEIQDALKNTVAKLQKVQKQIHAAVEAHGKLIEISKIDAMFDLDPQNFERDTGYIGAHGRIFKAVTLEELNETIQAASAMNEITPEQVIVLLMDGQAVDWQRSPNYDYDHAHGYIRMKESRAQDLGLMRQSASPI